jgi:hypothetical protein
MNADWIKARIAEHDQMYQQSLATANAHSGAKQAYERMLGEMNAARGDDAPKESAEHLSD